MVEVHDRVLVGSEQDCRTGDSSTAVVHACKSPCHQRAVGYRGSLPSTHPNYLVLETEFDLFLNIIDPPVPLFKPELFSVFLAFAGRHWDDGRILLIHCNQGESRAPSLALLFLAKHVGSVAATSYEEAAHDFRCVFPGYRPGRGIQPYLARNWYGI